MPERPIYTVVLSKIAKKQLSKLPERVADLLLAEIFALADDPRPTGCKKLVGRDGFRIRKDDYRIIYDVFDAILIVEIVSAGHRKQIYE